MDDSDFGGKRERLLRLLEPAHDETRAFARRLCESDADGDDLFHEAVLRALDKIHSLRDDSAFRLWFYRVIASIHRNRARSSFWRRLVPLPLDDDLASTEEWSSDMPLRRAGAERIRRALAKLPTEQRQALVLHELQGMSVNEVAAVQDASASAVKSRLSRGRARLRKIYESRMRDPETGPTITTPFWPVSTGVEDTR